MPKALIVLSSARTLPLSEPAGHPGISTGFWLIELAAVLAAFESDHEFVLATPDGRPPQLDINGLGLQWHAGHRLGPASVRSAVQSSLLRLGPTAVRRRNQALAERRNTELALARKHLGRIPVSEPLPRTDQEARDFRDTVVRSLNALPEHRFHSIPELLHLDSDPGSDFSFTDLSFVHLPGGSATTVDFHTNPQLGEMLNRCHDAATPLSLICHAPVALTSAQYRLDEAGAVVTTSEHPFTGARVTSLSKAGVQLGTNFQFLKVPGRRTRVTYYVDQVLADAGFKVLVPRNPSAARTVWDQRHQLLTANGPQAVDDVARKLLEVTQARAGAAKPFSKKAS